MKVLIENIARRVNKEDECTGHFREARFKSQALLHERAVLSVRVEEDVAALNPHRHGRAQFTHPVPHNYCFAMLIGITMVNFWLCKRMTIKQKTKSFPRDITFPRAAT